MEEVKKNLLKSLLISVGQKRVCDSLVAISKSYDVLIKEVGNKNY